MLKKLLKYDLQANLKIYILVWPALIALALLNRLGLTTDLEGTVGNLFVGTTTALFVLAVIAANILSFVISIIRYYSGLLKQEGYLMFTLPVKPWQLILSKFVTAILTIVVTMGLSFLCCIFVFDGVEGMLEFIKGFWKTLNIETGPTMVLTCLILFVSICDGILQIYTACAIGHQFRKHRVLMSVVAYYAIYIALEIIGVTAISTLISMPALPSTINGGLGILLGCQVALGVIYFFVAERLLRKRLNLE